MKQLAIMVAFLAVFCLSCSTPGGSTVTTPVGATGAQTVGNDQGTAQATESGSATNNNNPTLMIVNAAKKVTITVDADGATAAQVEGAEDAEVNISGAYFGVQRFGDDGMQAEVSSGGGSAGAAGASATKVSGDSGNNSAAPVVVKPAPKPAPPVATEEN